MKHVYLRSCLALLCATSLAACGGSSGSLIVKGQITGLTKTGLVLTNNGGPDLAIDSGATSFSFPQLIDTDANFDVQIKTQPTGAVCTMVAGTNTGKASFNINSVQVACITNAYSLGGSVTGRSAGLVLVNAPDKLNITENGAFVFGAKVADGAPYVVTIFTAPSSGSQCSIANGEGRMGTADINNVAVTCP